MPTILGAELQADRFISADPANGLLASINSDNSVSNIVTRDLATGDVTWAAPANSTGTNTRRHLFDRPIVSTSTITAAGALTANGGLGVNDSNIELSSAVAQAIAMSGATLNVGTRTAHQVVIMTNNAVAVTIASGGAATFSGSLAVTGGDFSLTRAAAIAQINLHSSGGSGRSYAIQSRTDGSYQITDDSAGAIRLTIASSGAVTIPGAVSLSATLAVTTSVRSPIFKPADAGNVDLALRSAGLGDVVLQTGEGGTLVTRGYVRGSDGALVHLGTLIQEAAGGLRHWFNNTANRFWSIGNSAVNFTIRDESGAADVITITNTGEQTFAATTIKQVMAGVVKTFRAGGSISLVNDGTQTVPVNNGSLVFVSENNTGDGAIYFCGYKSATVVLLADPNGRYAATDTAGKVCLFKVANSGTATLKNRLGGTLSFTVYAVSCSD